MKKISVLLLSCLLAAIALGKSKNEKSGIGFQGGLVLSSAGFPEEGSDPQTNRMKIGGFGGVCYEKQFGKVMAFELSVLYADLGVTAKKTIFGNKVTSMQNFHVVQLPINLKFYVIKQFNLYIGGYGQYMFAWRAHTITKDAGGDKISDERSKNLLKDDVINPEDTNGHHYIQPWDGGVQAGLEYISNIGLGVGARFQKGLIDITNNKFALDDGNWVTNSSLQIYLVGHF